MQLTSKNRNKHILKGLVFALGFALLVTLLLFYFRKDNITSESSFEQNSRTILLDWYKLYLQLERIDKNEALPYAARNFAQISTGVYEVVKENEHLFNAENPQALRMLNYALYISIDAVYDKNKLGSAATLINGLYQANNRRLHVKKNDNELFIQHILEVNNKLFRVDTLDLESPVFANYKPEKEFVFSDNTGMLPDWGKNKTLVVNKNEVKVDPPYIRSMYFEKELYDDALSVYIQSKQLSFEDIWIGDFWSDETVGLTFTPIGRWISIANQTLAMENLPVLQAIKMYRDLGVALYDVTIIGWFYKYKYNLIRPEQFIRKYIDASWQAKHHPAFPSYPSAHSFIAGAAGGILEHYFDKNAKRTDDSHHKRIEFYSDKRVYDSFEAMYKECAYSRFLVGVHYLTDCEAGLNFGLSVAKKVIRTNE